MTDPTQPTLSTSDITHRTATTSRLSPAKSALLTSCISAGCLSFGTYTLKSGRQSPYFFNAGTLHTGTLVRALAKAFAETIASSFGTPADRGFDIVFGPAYKGITLASDAVGALAEMDAERYGEVSRCFNRKEAKTHGDGGSIVGAPMRGRRVLIVDDVITAGTAKREAVKIIEAEGGEVVGLAIVLDRQERAPSRAEGGEAGMDGEDEKMSALGMVRREFGIPVVAVLTLDDIIEGYKTIGTEDDIKRLEEYRERYKAADP